MAGKAKRSKTVMFQGKDSDKKIKAAEQQLNENWNRVKQTKCVLQQLKIFEYIWMFNRLNSPSYTEVA